MEDSNICCDQGEEKHILSIFSIAFKSFFVLPECRGNGYGKKLVEAIQKEAKAQGIQNLFLEVRVSNAIAIALYEKCGFKKINIRKKYYSDGEDALIYAFGGV